MRLDHTHCAARQTMRDDAFQNRERLLTDRAFCVGAALYLALCIGAVAAFGDTVSENGPEIIADMNSSGTLILGDNANAPFGPNRFDFVPRAHPHRGALVEDFEHAVDAFVAVS